MLPPAQQVVIDAETAKAYRQQWEEEEARLERCKHCGGWHLRSCPRVREMTFHPDGRLAGVKFWESWDDSEVIYPEQIMGVEDAEV